MNCAVCEKKSESHTLVCAQCQVDLVARGATYCSACRREVPMAPTFRGAEGVACAHVREPRGEQPPTPCPNAPEAFDAETQAEVYSNPRWWDAGLGVGPLISSRSAPDAAPIILPVQVSPPPHVVAPPKVGATKVVVDKKGDFVITGMVPPLGNGDQLVSETEVKLDADGSPTEQTIKKLEVKRAPRKRKKKADVDVDDWTP